MVSPGFPSFFLSPLRITNHVLRPTQADDEQEVAGRVFGGRGMSHDQEGEWPGVFPRRPDPLR